MSTSPILPRPPQPVPGSATTVKIILDAPVSPQDIQYAREVLEFVKSFPHRSLCVVTAYEERSGPAPGFSYTHLAGSLTPLDMHIASNSQCVWFIEELVAELDSMIDLLATAQQRVRIYVEHRS